MDQFIPVIAGALLVLYVLGVAWVSFKASGDAEDYLVAGRRRGGFAAGLSITVGWVGGMFFGYYADAIYDAGWTYMILWPCAVVLGYLLFGIILPKLKEYADSHHIYMLPDYFHLSHSRRCGFAVLFCNFFLFLMWLIAQFTVGAKLISGVAGISIAQSVTAMCALTLPYLLAGGFNAVITTDVVQYFLLIALSLLLVPILLFRLGDIVLPPSDRIFVLDAKDAFVTIFLGALWVVASGDLWHRIYATSNMREAKRSLIWAAISYIVITPLMCLPFLVSYELVATVKKEEFLLQAFNHAFTQAWSPIFLFILMVAILSTVDTTAMGAAMSLTNDLALKLGWIKRGGLKLWTRVAIAIVTVISAVLSVMNPSMVKLVYSMMGLASCMVPAILASFCERWRFCEPAIFYSVVGAVGLYLIGYFTPWFSGHWWSDLVPIVGGAVVLVIVDLVARLRAMCQLAG